MERIYDVGVAGLHRLLGHLDTVQTRQCTGCLRGHGRRFDQRLSPDWSPAPSSPFPQALATARPSAGSPRFSLCSTPAPAAASPSSTSTTASARPCYAHRNQQQPRRKRLQKNNSARPFAFPKNCCYNANNRTISCSLTTSAQCRVLLLPSDGQSAGFHVFSFAFDVPRRVS